ncbi:MAG: hypothetical protein Q8J64_02195 [Thermodesulfovibrionales bacterium]|nr:hypothetical protein [Thermodesulfovibrionales bacterium]
MIFFKGILNFLLSLRTAIWLLLSLLFLLFYGALAMPGGEAFQSINHLPLFSWIKENSFLDTWWLVGSIFVLSLLTANTLFCSVESIIKKMDKRQRLLIISPQVIHIGFLLMLLAHLVSSTGSMKATSAAYEGTRFDLAPGEEFIVKSISISLGPEGYVTDWRADIEHLSGGTKKEGYLAPNRPFFAGGFGIYLKDAQAYPVKAILLEIRREPGAPWAFAGGLLFMAGTIALIAAKIRKED